MDIRINFDEINVEDIDDELFTVKLVAVKGDKGDKGDTGIVAFEIDNNGHLIAISDNPQYLDTYEIENGHLYLTLN